MRLTCVAVILGAFGMLAPVAGLAQVPELCDFMAGRDVAPKAGSLEPAVQKAQAGEWAEAYRLASKVAEDLSAKAASLFLDAQTPDGFKDARLLVDSELLTTSGVLAVRKDYFSVRKEVAAWLAWLACRSDQVDSAMFWLRIGTRDHLDVRFFQEGALVQLSAGNLDEARQHLVEAPEAPYQSVALGWSQCLDGKTKEGAAWLEKAATQVSNVDLQKIVRQWAGACTTGKLKNLKKNPKKVVPSK